MTEPWDSIIRKIENTPTPKKITLDGLPEATVDGDAVRLDVFTRHYENLIKAFEKAKG